MLLLFGRLPLIPILHTTRHGMWELQTPGQSYDQKWETYYGSVAHKFVIAVRVRRGGDRLLPVSPVSLRARFLAVWVAGLGHERRSVKSRHPVNKISGDSAIYNDRVTGSVFGARI